MSSRSRTVRQSIFTIIAKADPLRVAELEAYLKDIDDQVTRRSTLPAQPSAIPFEALDMLHFCSFTVFHDDYFGPYLVFENNVDGSPGDYIDALCNAAASALHTIYGFCSDYGSPNTDGAFLRRYLRRHIVRPAAAFVGNVGRSARRIRHEAALAAQIHEFLDDFDASEGTAADAVVAAVRRFVRGNAGRSSVFPVQPRLSFRDRVFRWSTAIGSLAVAIALLPVWLIPFLIILRLHETTDAVNIPGPPPEQLQELTDREDRIVQNHMASLCYLKPGWFRRWTLRVVLFFANRLARISTNGTLSGLDSLHFAHWALIDNDSRLLFLTNYDGSWENYLDDFIDKAAVGLTAIWSNTLNFPRTTLLVLDGARDERKFKAISRTTQASTNVWYSAYPALTVSGIENNTAICEGLSVPPNVFDAKSWLRRF